jgi:large repetitive protein
MPRLPAFLILLLATAPATAAVIEVNRLDDVADPIPGDGVCNVEPINPVPQCTLRAAIQTANGRPGHDTIVLPPGHYKLSRSGDGGADLGDLDITDAVDILGFVGDAPSDASDLPLIDGVELDDRIVRVHGDVDVLLRGLRLQGGQAGGEDGGAIRNDGRLTVEHVAFRANRAARGGAIFQTGLAGTDPTPWTVSLTVRDSHFERNDATQEGGAILAEAAAMAIERSSFRDNRSGWAFLGPTLSTHSSTLLLSDSTLDGESIEGPVFGLSSQSGVRAISPQNLVLRNVTATGFGLAALDLLSLSASRRVRVANSILAGSATACRADGPDPAGADVLIAHSLVQGELNCAQHYHDVESGVAELAGMLQDAGRLTWSRAPAYLYTNVVDTGIAPGLAPLSPELACTASDQRGSPRPLDGDGDDVARCDLGAVEFGEPTTFVVDTEGDDVDDVPGDGACETLAGECTLRAAVMEANALPGIQRIRFAADLDPIQLILPPHPDATGGDLDVTEALIINGLRRDGQPATLIHQTVEGERIFDLEPGASGPVTLRNLHLSGGQSGPSFGGALRITDGSARVEWSRFSQNQSPLSGGAVAVQGNAQLGLMDSDLHDNEAGERGSAAFVGSGAALSLSRSSVWNNGGFDGDIPVAAVAAESGAILWVQESTLSGNSAGIRVQLPDAFFLFGSTIAAHLGDGLKIQAGPGSNLGLATSILAGNGSQSGSDCDLGVLDPADVLVHTHLLSSDGSCTAGSPTSFIADPLLGPLLPRPGHPSRAHWPALGDGQVSPALDVADAAFCSQRDQYGQTRPVDLLDVEDVNGPCDLGAVEHQRERLFGSGFE